jgi:hypothetical protein
MQGDAAGVYVLAATNEVAMLDRYSLYFLY